MKQGVGKWKWKSKSKVREIKTRSELRQRVVHRDGLGRLPYPTYIEFVMHWRCARSVPEVCLPDRTVLTWLASAAGESWWGRKAAMPRGE